MATVWDSLLKFLNGLQKQPPRLVLLGLLDALARKLQQLPPLPSPAAFVSKSERHRPPGAFRVPCPYLDNRIHQVTKCNPRVSHMLAESTMAERVQDVDPVKKEDGEKEQIVTPWEAHAAEGATGIDYDKLISKRMNNFSANCVREVPVFLRRRAVWQSTH